MTPVHARDAEADLRAEVARLQALLVTADEEHARLTFELGHRVKNTLSVVQALAGQTMRGAATKEEALDTFGKRIASLARANDVILRESWTDVAIRSVAEGVLMPLGMGERLDIAGPDLRIGAGAALALAMALHELATNAKRFGAWSGASGHVTLAWSIEPAGDDPTFVLTWRETGGDAVVPPAKRGFGLKLIEQSLRSAIGPDVTLQFPASGAVCEARGPLSRVQS